MNNKTIAAIAIAVILVVLGAGYAVAGPGSFRNGIMGGSGSGYGMMGGSGSGYGMMGGSGSGYGMMGGSGSGYGMMGGSGSGYGMMGGSGSGYGMMGGSGQGYGMMGRGINGEKYGYGNYCGSGAPAGYGDNSTPITIEEAKSAVIQYISKPGNDDLKLAEIIQFDNHFYAGVKEKSTGKYAFELIVNKYTGAVVPEMGPNMMWNTKYGHMTYGDTQTTVTEEQALKNAQEYLDRTQPGSKVNEADTYYGYYTMEVTKDGKISGMLSVNSNTGNVWYHRWHGAFVQQLEVE